MENKTQRKERRSSLTLFLECQIFIVIALGDFSDGHNMNKVNVPLVTKNFFDFGVSDHKTMPSSTVVHKPKLEKIMIPKSQIVPYFRSARYQKETNVKKSLGTNNKDEKSSYFSPQSSVLLAKSIKENRHGTRTPASGKSWVGYGLATRNCILRNCFETLSSRRKHHGMNTRYGNKATDHLLNDTRAFHTFSETAEVIANDGAKTSVNLDGFSDVSGAAQTSNTRAHSILAWKLELRDNEANAQQMNTKPLDNNSLILPPKGALTLLKAEGTKMSDPEKFNEVKDIKIFSPKQEWREARTAPINANVLEKMRYTNLGTNSARKFKRDVSVTQDRTVKHRFQNTSLLSQRLSPVLKQITERIHGNKVNIVTEQNHTDRTHLKIKQEIDPDINITPETETQLQLRTYPELKTYPGIKPELESILHHPVIDSLPEIYLKPEEESGAESGIYLNQEFKPQANQPSNFPWILVSDLKPGPESKPAAKFLSGFHLVTNSKSKTNLREDPEIEPNSGTEGLPKFEPEAKPGVLLAFKPEFKPEVVPEFEPEASPASGPNFKPEAESEVAPEFDPEAVPEFVPEFDPEAVPEVVPEFDPETVPEVVPEFDPEAVPEVEPEFDPETVPEVVPEFDPEAVPEVVPEFDPEAVPEVVPEFDPEAVPEVAPEFDPEAAPEVVPEFDSEAVPEVAPEFDQEAVPEVVPEFDPEAAPEVVPEFDPEAAPEVGPEFDPEAVPEVVPEFDPVAVPEVVPEFDPEAVPEVAPEFGPEAAPEVVPEFDPEAAPEVVPEFDPEAVPEVVPEFDSETVPEVGPEFDPEAAPEVVPEFGPEAVPEVVPEFDSETVPEVGPEFDPEAVPEIVPKAETKIVPKFEPNAEPESLLASELDLKPKVVPEEAPEVQPEVVREYEPEAERDILPKFELEAKQEAIPESEPNAKHQVITEFEKETELDSESEVIPMAETEFEQSAEPQVVPAARPKLVPEDEPENGHDVVSQFEPEVIPESETGTGPDFGSVVELAVEPEVESQEGSLLTPESSSDSLFQLEYVPKSASMEVTAPEFAPQPEISNESNLGPVPQNGVKPNSELSSDALQITTQSRVDFGAAIYHEYEQQYYKEPAMEKTTESELYFELEFEERNHYNWKSPEMSTSRPESDSRVDENSDINIRLTEEPEYNVASVLLQKTKTGTEHLLNSNQYTELQNFQQESLMQNETISVSELDQQIKQEDTFESERGSILGLKANADDITGSDLGQKSGSTVDYGKKQVRQPGTESTIHPETESESITEYQTLSAVEDNDTKAFSAASQNVPGSYQESTLSHSSELDRKAAADATPENISRLSPTDDYNNIGVVSAEYGNATGFVGNMTSNASASDEAGTELGSIQWSSSRILLFIIQFVIMIETIFGNLMVILSVKVEKKLQTPFNYYIVNLAFTDMNVGLSVMSLFMIYNLYDYFPFGSFLCDYWIWSDYTMTFESVMTLAAISVDRLWSVTWSLHYRNHNSGKKSLLIILGTWVWVALIWLPPFFYDRAMHTYGPGICYWDTVLNKNLVVWVGFLGYYIPFFTMVGAYARIMWVVKKRASSIRDAAKKDSIVSQPTETSVSGETGPSEQKKLVAPGPSAAIDERQEAKLKREMKAVYTLLNIVVIFLICWVPFYTLFVLSAWFPSLFPDWYVTFSYWMAYINSAVNPILYPLSSLEFRAAYKKVFNIMLCKD